MKTIHRSILLTLVTGLALLAGSCKGTIDVGDPDGGDEQTIRLTTLGLEGTTQDDSAVQVGEQPDQDGVDDTAWQVGYTLDDVGGPTSLPADTGGQQSYTLNVQSTRTSDGQQLYRKVTVTLYE